MKALSKVRGKVKTRLRRSNRATSGSIIEGQLPTLAAPVLVWTSSESVAYPVGQVFLDETIVAGDIVESQIQVAGGSWTSLLANTSHVITSDEIISGDLDLIQGPFGTGTYDWRVRTRRAIDNQYSFWSNTETKTLAIHDETFDTDEAKAYFARLRDAGLSTDKAFGDAVADLINGLVGDGVWDRLDALWLTAVPSLAIARLNLVSASFALVDLSGSPAFVAYRGVKGVGASILSTQFIPSTAGGVFELNSAHAMIWANEEIDSQAGDLGTLAGTGDHVYIYTDTPTGPFGNALRVNGASGSDPFGHTTSGKGFYLGSRDNSTTRTAYHAQDGIFTNYGTGGSGVTSALPNTVLYFGSVNGNGGGLKQLSAGSVGASLTSVQAESYYDRLQTYMTAVGNV